MHILFIFGDNLNVVHPFTIVSDINALLENLRAAK